MKQAQERFAQRPFLDKVLGLIPTALEPNCPERNEASGLLLQNSLAPIQGSNYAFAKLIQRARTVVTGPRNVISNVAPASLTYSVMHNSIVRAGILGCERFGIVPFLPETANVIMSLLLIHDLNRLEENAQAFSTSHPLVSFQHNACHGGTWRSAYYTQSTTEISVPVFYANRANQPAVHGLLAFTAGALLSSRL